MKVVLLGGHQVEVAVDPADLWSVYKLVKAGKLEAVLTNTAPICNLRKIDPERTFGDLIHDDCPDTERSERLPAAAF